MPGWSGSLVVMRTVLPGLSSFVVVVGDVSAGVAGVSVAGGVVIRRIVSLALVGRFSVGCCVDGHAPEPMILFFRVTRITTDSAITTHTYLHAAMQLEELKDMHARL